MILANGKIYDSSEQNRIIERLEEEINITRMEKRLDSDLVINALDSLGKLFANGEFSDIAAVYLKDTPQDYFSIVPDILKAENLKFRLDTELPAQLYSSRCFSPAYGIGLTETRILPLGTLFHIAAGNMDGLSMFTVAEGLLTGNVNILKLPQADNGLTLAVFERLIEKFPELAPFIYIFDTPSSDIEAMKKMARMSDGIITWGGDEAIGSVRAMSSPGTRLIEWGHKLSFAYISGYENRDEELDALARHIIDTRQLLCSSCQTIFIDTEKQEEVLAFCREFLPFLENAAKGNPVRDAGIQAEISLRRYTSKLEDLIGKGEQKDEFIGEGCSLYLSKKKGLELSSMYGNCPVKKLPRRRLFEELRNSKNYLQTAGLICSPELRDEITSILSMAGVNRVLRPGNMSATFCGEGHDGEYPLSRYVRIVNIEK